MPFLQQQKPPKPPQSPNPRQPPLPRFGPCVEWFEKQERGGMVSRTTINKTATISTTLWAA
eukprot:869479-Ditylum_brightwellii.AAC.1